MINLVDVQEFRTTWNNELFHRNQSIVRTAKRLIRKSLFIVQIRSFRQLKYLTKELQIAKRDKEILQNSLANHLQQRLKSLQTQMNDYKKLMNDLVQQEKVYWKQLEGTIAKRINPRHLAVVNTATFVTHTEINNENLPPMESTSPVKIPKIRSKRKLRS